MTMHPLRFLRLVWASVRPHLPFKLALIVILNVWICVPYYLAQRHPWRPPVVLTPSILDRSIPFCPGWAWVYESLFVMLPIGPFLMRHAGQLWRYTWAMVAIGLLTNTIFFVWPTACTRPELAAADLDPFYRVVVSWDRSSNSLPSLHATLAVFSVLCMREVRLGRLRLRWRVVWPWVLIILGSTLLTKQHLLIDLITGGTIGATAYVCAFHLRRSAGFRCSSSISPRRLPINTSL